MTARRAGRRRRRRAPLAPPADTGEALGLPPAAADRHRSASGRRCSTTGSASPARRPAALVDLPDLPRRRARARPHRRRPRASRPAPTTRRSPSTRSATWPASAAGVGRDALVRSSASAARPDEQRPGHAAQPDGVQGRHPQHRGRGHRGDRRASSGSATRPTSPGCAAARYLVARRIRMRIESWDRDFAGDQEDVIGRVKVERRAARRQQPSTTRSTSRRRTPTASRSSRPTRTSGSPRPRANGGAADPAPRLLVHRRHRPGTGELDAGLFFICLPAGPAHGSSSPIQRQLAGQDALNEYIRHTGSASSPARPERRPAAHGGTASSAEAIDGRDRRRPRGLSRRPVRRSSARVPPPPGRGRDGRRHRDGSRRVD